MRWRGFVEEAEDVRCEAKILEVVEYVLGKLGQSICAGSKRSWS